MSFNSVRFDIVTTVPNSQQNQPCGLCRCEITPDDIEAKDCAAHWVTKNRQYACYIHTHCIEEVRDFAIQQNWDFKCPGCRRPAQNVPTAVPPTLFQTLISSLPRPRTVALIAAAPFAWSLLQKMTFIPALFAGLGACSGLVGSGIATAIAREWLTGTERKIAISLSAAAAALGSASALAASDGGIQALSLGILASGFAVGALFLTWGASITPMMFRMRVPLPLRESFQGGLLVAASAGLSASILGSELPLAGGLALVPLVMDNIPRL